MHRLGAHIVPGGAVASVNPLMPLSIVQKASFQKRVQASYDQRTPRPDTHRIHGSMRELLAPVHPLLQHAGQRAVIDPRQARYFNAIADKHGSRNAGYAEAEGR